MIKITFTALSILHAEEIEVGSYAERVLTSLEEDCNLHSRIEFTTANKLRNELQGRKKQLRWLARRDIKLEKGLLGERRLKA